MDRCPKCKSQEVSWTELTGEDLANADMDVDSMPPEGMECHDCYHIGEEYTFWPTLDELGLSENHCEACGCRRSFGCGHSTEQEIEGRDARLERERAEYEARKVEGGLGRVFV